VILDPARTPDGLNDSKKLTERARAALEPQIKAAALAWGVGFASVEEIDALNILQATGLAMRRAVEALKITPAHALVDGNYRFVLPCPVTPVVGGDGKSLSIAAASILAKVARDRLMVEMDALYPGYGFAGHKGADAAWTQPDSSAKLGANPGVAGRLTPALLNAKVTLTSRRYDRHVQQKPEGMRVDYPKGSNPLRHDRDR
jgi:ribonuclease HII